MNDINITTCPVVGLGFFMAHIFLSKRAQVVVHAFCLMRNHYHLLLEKPQGNLVFTAKDQSGVSGGMIEEEAPLYDLR